MRKNLRAFICICILGTAFSSAAQEPVKGNPQLKTIKPFNSKLEGKSSKLHGELRNLYNRTFNPDNAQKKSPLPGDRLDEFMQVQGDNVVVDITVGDNINQARAELEKKGLKVTGVFGRIISGIIPIKALPQLETAASVKFAKPAYSKVHGGTTARNFTEQTKGNATTPVISQGDTAQRSHIARKNYGVNGKGVKVGILSDSYNILGTASDGVKQGELPGAGNPFGFTKPVQVLQDGLPGSTDEGRGMAEIVHDVAPGAALAFSTAYGGQAAFALNILELADSGCNIIVDDLIYFAEPYFQDGIVAQAVDKVKKQGVTFFSAAGNSSIRSYESQYRKSNFAPFGPNYGTAHDFSASGDAPRYFQPVYIPRFGNFRPSFQWDEPFFSAGGAGSRSDLDIYLLDISGNVVDSSIDGNIYGSGDAWEYFNYYNFTESETFFLLVLKYAGPDPKRLKYINYGYSDFYLTTPAIPGLLAPTIVGHAKAAGAIAVAAAPWFETPAYGVDTPQVEPFSSLGGVANYFDKEGNRTNAVVRRKPEITAPDGGNNSFFGGDLRFLDRDTFPNFFGTSAAAPHAAGVAALMIEAQKLGTLTPDQIKGFMSVHTKDMDNPYTPGFDKGFDYSTGGGLIRADALVNRVRYPNVYVNNLRLTALCSDDPATIRRWQIHNSNAFPVEVTWYVAGTTQYGTITARPRSTTTFTTQTVSSSSFFIPNVVVISWQDNFGVPRFYSQTSTSDNCNSTVLTEAKGQNGSVAINEQMATRLNKAEVYPNPSTGNFRLSLSTANPVNTDIELYSADGKLLLKQKAYANGIFDINTINYKPGIYLLRIRQDKFTKTFRLVKQ